MATSAAPARAGYQGFGSFMVDQSVESMIATPDSEYVPPELPFDLHPPPLPLFEDTPLGANIRQLFMVDFDSWTFLNHGAFGAVCLPAHHEASQWREHCERQPLAFLDRQLFPHVVRVMREMAGFINAQPQDLVLLPNATTGLNVVLQSAGLSPGDALYMLDIGYGSVKKMAQAACGGAEVVMGSVEFPISGPEAIIDLVSRTLPANAKLAVFDAVTSNTALVLPLRQLVELCRERGVPVLIDAAHALGQLHVDVTALDPDYYVTNCHKWFAGPRGSALLWVSPRAKSGIRPLVVSHGSGSGFTSDFIWDGCRDYAAYLGLSSALRMWRQLGPERCRQYMCDLLGQAVQLLTSSWGTSTLAPLFMCASMALVGLPERLAAQQPATSADAKHIQDALHFQHRIEVPIKCIQGRLFVRISAYIYNTLEDYQKLAAAVGMMVVA